MAKEKNVADVSFIQDLFSFGVYKRNQGRVTRQLTFAALGVTLLLGCWQLHNAIKSPSDESWMHGTGLDYLIPAGILAIGLWISYRVVNYPQFSDFLISVEAEMTKVSWPSRTELIRSSLVVIILMFFLAGVLFGFDIIWRQLFILMGIIPEATQTIPDATPTQ